LVALLEAGEGMYQISELKQEPRDFSYKALRQEVARRKIFQPLYEFGRSKVDPIVKTKFGPQ
jgi:pSer/pThr/pTyr-binding forkhead associated (FHA) protein